jgi:DNA-binding NtrC family response regulator
METSILLIDQEPILIEPLRREFGSHSILLRVAASVSDAELLVEETPPDLVIIDADMPDVPRFITRVRELDQPVILIGLTSSSEKRIHLLALGIETVILKREGPQPILDAVRHYVDPDADAHAFSPNPERSEILVVDDEEDFLTLLSKMLDMWGHTPLTAVDGEQAMEIIDSHPGIAAVLLDLRLPGKGGMEVLREVQKRNPRIGVIMLSGLSDREIARQAIKLGAFDYVTKPPDFPTLQSTIIACLSHTEYQSQSWWKKLMG